MATFDSEPPIWKLSSGPITVRVALGERSYDIVIGRGLLASLGNRVAALKPGESIVIFGAGPVGLMATLSARIQGASQIFVVDGEADARMDLVALPLAGR